MGYKNSDLKGGFHGHLADEKLNLSRRTYRFTHKNLGSYDVEVDVLYRDPPNDVDLRRTVLLGVQESFGRGIDGNEAAEIIRDRLLDETFDIVYVKAAKPVPLAVRNLGVPSKYILTGEDWKRSLENSKRKRKIELHSV